MATPERISGPDVRIALIGAGTIGLSLAALHLTHLADASHLTIMDVRADLSSYVATVLPTYLPPELHKHVADIKLTSSVAEAVKDCTIVQESGPEDLAFKTQLWADVERLAPSHAMLWTSTSGIPAAQQSASMTDKTRLLVVHPFNPPHILPLLEIVPSALTSEAVVAKTMEFWRRIGREPVLLKRDITGFVAGRLAWALLREAIHLVDQDVVTVEQLDRILETSMGPRWAYAGPFKSFHAGGGPGGLAALLGNVGRTVQACWDDGGRVNMGGSWEAKVFAQTEEAYGRVDLGERDRANRLVLEAVREAKKA
ncbi:3-hydroxyacyl-CoA dehydrogenase [Purpureocillium lavendulum]|uniref:3-hydroxyacyl-CoA dehydrogenase n=1 Tax=Purpureocillium lavendulum TaxID=1247861 RepID=A0AB34G3V6_9HYPO|nr:3-hydroxyacyl-CoA dehydrogenase [Purpureocillium lavendulum]